MEPENFPALYRSADGSAAEAQGTYLWLIRLQYFLLTVAATISIWFGNSPDLYIGYALALAASTGLLLYMAVLLAVLAVASSSLLPVILMAVRVHSLP